MKVSPRYDGPALLAFDGPVDDQLVPVTRQRRRFRDTLASLSDDEWSAPTRCEGWTTQEVVAHLVGVDAYWNMSIEAGLAGSPTRVLDGFDPAATPPMLIEPLRVLPRREVFDQYAASQAAFLTTLAALDQDQWSVPAESPAGHVPIRLLVQHALWDSWIHERDVTLPRGLAPPIEADEVVASLRYAAAISPGFLIASGGIAGPAYAVEAQDPDDAFWIEAGESVTLHDGPAPAGTPTLSGNAVDLTDALSIRAPLPASAPAEWHEVLGGLATAFT